MTTPRDEYGDPVRSAEVCREDDLTDGDHLSIQPRTRTAVPKLAGAARPVWADEYLGVWRR